MAVSMSVIALVLAASAPPIQATTFLGAHPKVEMQSMDTQELELMLLAELASFDTDARLGAAAAELRPLYTALPKNEGGKLDPTVVRYALHRFFAGKYGWHLRGLEPRGGAWNATSPATIMKDRAPSYIMDVFEKRLHGNGFSLKELASFAVTLSDLIHREAASDLEDIFLVMGNSRSSRVTETDMRRLIKTYLMTYINGVHTATNSSADYQQMENMMESNIFVWFDAKMWAQDMRRSHLYSQRMRRNPFIADYSLEDVIEVAQELGHHFGNFQNMECKALKEKLTDMEHAGSGRVSLSQFYSGIGMMNWPFIESVDYLRNLGALDESDPRRPSVIIANFLGSSSNCEAPSNFYSVCCMDECESLMDHVEAAVAAPTASAALLADVVSKMQSDTVPAPRSLSSVQTARLEEIAQQNGGSVPLHGRLFAQWMHHSYPRECRFPHVAGSTSPLTRDEFTSKFGVDHEVTDEELAKYVDNLIEPEVVILPWTDTEELIAPHKVASPGRPAQSRWSSWRVLALVALVLSAGVPMLNAKKHLSASTSKCESHLV